jgi:hypothetical protein
MAGEWRDQRVFSDRDREDSDRRRRGVLPGSLLFGRLVSPSSGGFSLSNSSVVAFCAVELDTLEMSKQNLVEK